MRPQPARATARAGALFVPGPAAIAAGFAAAALLLRAATALAVNVDADQAGRHVGETATVCGTVASAHFSARTPGAPTFLDLDKPYPDAGFTLVIFGRDRAKFGTPETALLGRRVCATGVISRHRGRPEMILQDPSQLGQ